MKKQINVGARIAAFAAASVTGLIAAATVAQAQAWFELRTWSPPRYYDEAPVEVYREPPPRYGALPRRAVRGIVEREGFEVIGPIQLNGDVYIVPVEDMAGRVSRLVVDARDGEIVERAHGLTSGRASGRASGLASGLASGPPRPPANIGRSRDRYAATPYATDLPPPVEPRGGWRDEAYGGPVPPPAAMESDRVARERFARQSPDGAGPPRGRMDGLDVAPRLGPVPPPPRPRKAAEPKAQEPKKQRAAPKPPKAKPKQQAARTSPAEKPEAVKPEPAKPAAAKPQTEAPKTEAATTPAPAPAPAPKAGASKPEAAKPESAKEDSAKAKSETRKPTAENKPAAENRNSSLLRRPAQKPDSAATTRKGVAEAPTISTGAEPQRKAPRVVYPGPGASTQPPATDGE